MEHHVFQPHRLLRNRHLQSVLNSAGPRKWRARRHRAALAAATREHILDCGGGVRLQGFYTPAPGAPRGLVVLLHGWEGSADSAYMLSSAKRLVQTGFPVFRLNFRDHGQTHHLNTGIFHSCLLDEVVGGVKQIATLFPQRPLLIAGFSLGGNFALRVALKAPAAGIPVHHVFALCPVVSPAHTLDAMENGNAFYQYYFVRKWTRSLQRKQAAFPGRYDFSDLIRQGQLRAMTNTLVEQHSEFATLEAYLDGYAIGGVSLGALQVPATILAAADDPINPVGDFRQLKLNGNTKLVITGHGGHCGYVENFRFDSWAERFLIRRLSAVADDYHKTDPEHPM